MIVNPLKGIAYRLVLEKFQNVPISRNAALMCGFRYNPPPGLIQIITGQEQRLNSFKAEYLSDSEQTARNEVSQDTSGSTRILFEVEFSFSSLLDLTDHNVVADLVKELNPNNDPQEFQSSDLNCDWVKINAATNNLAPTQLLGYILHNTYAIEALKVPSVRNQKGYNIVVFIDNLQIGSYLIAKNGNTDVQRIDGSLKVK